MSLKNNKLIERKKYLEQLSKVCINYQINNPRQWYIYPKRYNSINFKQ